MIVIICIHCRLGIRVMPEGTAGARELDTLVGERSGLWPGHYVCPRCDAHMHGYAENQVEPAAMGLLDLRELTPKEAFSAFMGAGMPDEQDCTLESITQLLREKPVRKLLGHNVKGAKYVQLEAIELWDGTCVFLGAGGDGAVVYRVRAPINYTARALAKTVTP